MHRPAGDTQIRHHADRIRAQTHIHRMPQTDHAAKTQHQIEPQSRQNEHENTAKQSQRIKAARGPCIHRHSQQRQQDGNHQRFLKFFHG